MLIELAVHNFAIIRHLEVSFNAGLNILSGETGAGKSILVGAVNLILGSRASQEMIRTGAGEAVVEAIFSAPLHGTLHRRFEEWGLQPSEELQIRRSINKSGRNRVFVNDQAVTLQQLQQIAGGLISISGQHEHQLLLDSVTHLSLLDSFGDLDASCAEVGALYSEWLQTRDGVQKLRKLKDERAAQLDYMRFQLRELEAAGLQPDEDRALEEEKNLLRHSAALLEAAEGAYQKIYAGRGAILEQLSDVEKNLETLARIDKSRESLLGGLEQGRIHLEELAHSLQQYSRRISFDPQRLSAVEDRLAQIGRLARKYGGSVEAMLDRLAELREALAEEGDVDSKEDRMVEALEGLRNAYTEKAGELSRKRREAAVRLSEEVEKALAALDMTKARFSVEFNREENETGGPGELSFTATGIDRVEFFLSANPGEELKPLAKTASGGELSRILLALKGILSRGGEAETLIFDEVDAGIGGRTAELVGVQLMRLAQKHQVICITHLPQIACFGKHHYRVAKQSSEGETLTEIQALRPEDRVEELARMLGGVRISDKTRAHAVELLTQARDRSASGG